MHLSYDMQEKCKDIIEIDGSGCSRKGLKVVAIVTLTWIDVEGTIIGDGGGRKK